MLSTLTRLTTINRRRGPTGLEVGMRALVLGPRGQLSQAVQALQVSNLNLGGGHAASSLAHLGQFPHVDVLVVHIANGRDAKAQTLHQAGDVPVIRMDMRVNQTGD